MRNFLSLFGFGLMVAGLLLVVAQYPHVWSNPAVLITQSNPVALLVQGSAFAVIIWARLTFGLRSFHATANPTSGGLVRTGPYRYVRHPIYGAAMLLGLGCLVAYIDVWSVIGFLVLIAGALIRVSSEEQLLRVKYPEYVDYSRVTKRFIPALF